MKRLSSTLVILSLALVACGRARHHDAGAAAARPSVTKPARTGEVRDEWLIYAADNKCGDTLTKRYAKQLAFREEHVPKMERYIRNLERAKAEGRMVKFYERDVLDQYVRLRDFTESFDQHYGVFACERRRDGKLLSSDELGRGMAEIKRYVKKLGKELPKNQTNVLIEE